jgi:hypothetical protein
LFRHIAVYEDRGWQFSLSEEFDDWSGFVARRKSQVQSTLEQATIRRRHARDNRK